MRISDWSSDVCSSDLDLGLTVTFGDGLMTELPYADASFDYVLSFNVIYHGDAGVVGRAVAEIYRVLKPGGLFHGTLLSKRNRNYGPRRQIAPDTFVIAGAAGDKGHTASYCDADGVARLLEDVEPHSPSTRERAQH